MTAREVVDAAPTSASRLIGGDFNKNIAPKAESVLQVIAPAQLAMVHASNFKKDACDNFREASLACINKYGGDKTFCQQVST